MANRHGDFIWYELLMSDPAAAERFYGPVLGWRARRAEGSPVEYRIFGTGEAEVAGLMAIPPGAGAAGMRPGWIGYIGVDDVDAADQYPGRRRFARAHLSLYDALVDGYRKAGLLPA